MNLYLIIVILGISIGHVIAVDRIYYIAALERDWDYFPSDKYVPKTLLNEYGTFVNRSTDPPRIGHVYRKALYRQFTDATFTKEVPRPAWLGLLGPILKGEVGDTFVIHFFNNATSPLTLHPHGVLYEKNSEGAKYNDGTSKNDKLDDGVPPGQRHTYKWVIKESFGPTKTDSDCIPWAYHSHFMADQEIYAGLIGALITCKPGTLDANGNRKNVDKEYVLFVTVMDENASHYIKQNLQRLLPSATEDELSEIMENADYVESNMMHSINGYIYNNVPDFKACPNDKVSWYIIGMGNEVDIHSIHFERLSLTHNEHRVDTISLFPAIFLGATMTIPTGLQNSLIVCKIFDHYKAGMMAIFNTSSCNKPMKSSEKQLKVSHTYYIAAEEELWDYGPNGVNQFIGNSFSSNEFAKTNYRKGSDRIGGKYLKALFREYTDATFSIKASQPASLGYLGPTIHGEVDDVIEIVFKNNARIKTSIWPHGVQVDTKSVEEMLSEGVETGNTKSYHWTFTENMGPANLDGPCITRPYISYVTPADVYAGLMGAVVICRKGQLDRMNWKQANVSKEFVLGVGVMDENNSPYFDVNAKVFNDSIDLQNGEFMNSNRYGAINGYVYGNLPGLNVCLDDSVAWHVFGFGNELDIHSLLFHGQTFIYESSIKDTISVFPAITRDIIMKIDNPGIWPIECQVSESYQTGMRANLVVKACQNERKTDIKSPVKGKNRIYYIAAVEEEWNYAPVMINTITNNSLLDDENGKVFAVRDATHIGLNYKKVLYREYPNGQFKTRKNRSPFEDHLGMLGPIVRAEVGDEVTIVFKNMASRDYSLFTHGVKYKFSNEGVSEATVPPGGTFEYRFEILPRSGPASGDFNCTVWPYYSQVDPIKDLHSGLHGPFIVCRKGTLKEDGTRRDVERELVISMVIDDENESWYLDENIQKYCKTPANVSRDSEEFRESNTKHTVNGYMYDNVKGLEMIVGKRVAVHMFGLGGILNVHTVHFHGETFTNNGGSNRGDVMGVFPATTSTVEIIPENPGKWLLHCHVSDHIMGGMFATYTVKHYDSDQDNNECPKFIMSKYWIFFLVAFVLL